MNQVSQDKKRFLSNPDSDSALMIELLGEELFDRIRDAFGGMEISIPYLRTLSDSHILVKRLGWDDARSFCENFNGGRIYIPQKEKSSWTRDQYIINAINRGIPRNEIAQALGISTRALRRVTSSLGLSGYTAEDISEARIANAALSISNAGLTRHGIAAGVFPHPIHENRAYGA
ncbi:hypothetical protein ACLBWS_00110 [Brucellaceae bacterium D45D]